MEAATLSWRLIDVINHPDLLLDARITLGALKGILTLYGSKYVSHEAFLRILQEEFARFGYRQPWRLLN